MITLNTDNVYRTHFDSVLDAVHHLQSTPYKWKDRAPLRNDTYYGEAKWTLGHTANDVLSFARDGWEEGVRDVDLYARPVANARSNSWRADVYGEQLDINRYLQGRPDCMRRRGNVHGRRPVVSIFVNNWINMKVQADQMVKFGAAMVAAIDHIEQSGKRVELVAGTVAKAYLAQHRIMSATWTVKHAEDPLDLSAIAFSLAHPGASRRFGWRIWAHSDCPEDSAFGVAVDWQTKPEHLIDPAPDMLMIAGLNGHWDRCKTMEDARLLVAMQINQAAGETLVDLEEA
jgi:hypothetical protein